MTTLKEEEEESTEADTTNNRNSRFINQSSVPISSVRMNQSKYKTGEQQQRKKKKENLLQT